MSFAVQFNSVSFSYPKKKNLALDNVSLDIPKGSFFALLGANGAGKTTLLRLLCKRITPNSGTINYASSLMDKEDLARHKVGVLLENPGAYSLLSVAEYLSFFAKLYGDLNFSKNGFEILDKLSFSESLYTKVEKLSLGNKQKLQIARSMQHSPEILLLDEPAANLDPVSREELWKILAEWKNEKNKTLVVCSHILPELEKYASDFAILYQGKLCTNGNLQQMNPQETFAFEVDSAFKNQVEESLKKSEIKILNVQKKVSSVLEDSYREVYKKFSKK